MKRDTLDKKNIIDLDLHLSRLPQKEIVTEIKRPTLPPVNVDWDNILLEWSYRLPKGYPTIKDGEFSDPKELAVLQELLLEYGVSELPPLRVMEQEDSAPTQRTPRSMEDIQQLIQNMELSPEKLSKLYNVVKTFTIYDPIKQTLLAKTPNMTVDPTASKDDQKKTKDRIATKTAIYKHYTQQLKATLEELPGNTLLKFQKYLQDGLDGKREPQDFPTTEGTGKFNFPDEVADEVAHALAKHTAQDEQKKGVGQGEIMLTLIYDNIAQPAGKGDVTLDKEEMEVKGYNAVLGKGKPEQYPVKLDWIQPYVTAKTETGTDSWSKKIIRAYSKSVELGESEDFLDQFRTSLKATVLYKDLANSVDKYITKEAFVNSATLNKHVGVLNFLVYHKEEGFKWFLVHDYGARGGNTGTYVLAGGSVEDMAKTLLSNKNITFEAVGPNNMKPRIRLEA